MLFNIILTLSLLKIYHIVKMNQKIISVIGGSGFIGNYLVDKLLESGYYVKVISRKSKSKKKFYPSARLGQYSLINCNICDKQSIFKVLEGSSLIINLVGVLENRKKNSFHAAHIEGTNNIVKFCSKYEVEKLIHISAIGVNKNKTSKYAFTKFLAEKNISKAKNSLIIRPSIVFGDEDNFINFFAQYTKFSPFLPLIGGGNTKFQPILVSDLVNIIVSCINKKFNRGQVLEVGGPDILTFKQILTFILKELEIKRYFLNLPFNVASKMAFFLEKLPIKLITRDQVEMLKTNNTVFKKYSYRNFIEYESTSFYIAARNQLKFYKKNGGH